MSKGKSKIGEEKPLKIVCCKNECLSQKKLTYHHIFKAQIFGDNGVIVVLCEGHHRSLEKRISKMELSILREHQAEIVQLIDSFFGRRMLNRKDRQAEKIVCEKCGLNGKRLLYNYTPRIFYRRKGMEIILCKHCRDKLNALMTKMEIQILRKNKERYLVENEKFIGKKIVVIDDCRAEIIECLEPATAFSLF